MKKNKSIYIVIISILLLTGCNNKWLKDEENNIVRNDATTLCKICNEKCEQDVEKEQCLKDCEQKCEEYEKTANGQTLREDILCRPTNEEVINIYEYKNIDLSKIPECKKFKLKGEKYEGLWATFFVKPLAWLLLSVGNVLNNYGAALVLVSLFIRALMIPFTKGTTEQTEKMKKAQPEINSIELKYKDKTDQESTINKSQETIAVYKKYGINPFSSCLFAFIQIPILLAFISTINRIPAIFEGKFLGLHLGITPAIAISRGEWWYLLIVVLLGVVTYFSISQNKPTEQPGMGQQMKFMNIFMIVLITITSYTLSTAIGIYWISSSAFTIFQNALFKRGNKK